MDLRMTRTECEAFLAGTHVGVMAIEREGGPPLAVPVWYDYEAGGNVSVLIGPDSIKQKLLAKANRFSLCAQQEDLPYKYVSVEGPVLSSEVADTEAHSRPMAHRYLGQEFGDLYVEGGAGSDSLRVAMAPERWFSTDYAKL